MASRFTTAGMKLYYCGSSSSTAPAALSSYTQVPEVKSIPSLNPTPNAVDVTPLDEENYVVYASGLKDVGGALEFTANLNDSVVTAWGSAVAAYGSSGECWWCVTHPDLSNAVYFQGEPIQLGLNEASVGSPLETSLYIMPHSAPSMSAKPTT